MRRLAVAGLALVALMAAPSAANGQSIVFFGDTVSGQASFERQLSAPAYLSGRLSVRFHGDRAAGCEAAGVCDTSGTVTWTPGTSPDFAIVIFKSRGHRRSEGFLSFDPELGSPARTTAQVTRTRADGSRATCSDASARGSDLAFAGSGGQLDVDLTGSSTFGNVTQFLATRCPGPLDTDLDGLLPVGHLPLSNLTTHGERIDFSGRRSFAAKGLAGVADSNLVLDVGRARSIRGNDQSGRERYKRVRKRELEVRYAIEQVSGQVSLDFTGDGQSPLCDALDACDLRGSVALRPAVAHGTASVYAIVSARVSSLALLQRTGLVNSRGRHPIALRGFGQWSGPGEVVGQTSRPGAPDCSDRIPLDGGLLQLEVKAGSMEASYVPATFQDVFRTRCAGPTSDDIESSRPLATGSVPVEALRQPIVTLPLRQGASFEGQGYRGDTQAGLTITLRRTTVRERVVTETEAVGNGIETYAP